MNAFAACALPIGPAFGSRNARRPIHAVFDKAVVGSETPVLDAGCGAGMALGLAAEPFALSEPGKLEALAAFRQLPSWCNFSCPDGGS